MELIPFVHETRNNPVRVRFTDSHVALDMRDGRAIGMPLNFFPWLENATDSQRADYKLLGLSVYWESLDEGIDLTAMLTGLYNRPKPAPQGIATAAI